MKNNSKNRCLIVGGACLLGGIFLATERQIAAMVFLYLIAALFTFVSAIISDDV